MPPTAPRAAVRCRECRPDEPGAAWPAPDPSPGRSRRAAPRTSADRATLGIGCHRGWSWLESMADWQGEIRPCVKPVLVLFEGLRPSADSQYPLANATCSNPAGRALRGARRVDRAGG